MKKEITREEFQKVATDTAAELTASTKNLKLGISLVMYAAQMERELFGEPESESKKEESESRIAVLYKIIGNDKFEYGRYNMTKDNEKKAFNCALSELSKVGLKVEVEIR